ncbi:MAG: DNA polymerase III subunit gamma/tau [Candidatus Gracilibacteria bacterium]|nr:DNA polymerase III subunit gamma/tau [Candidatus Gracilibacteria bacterium]
MSLYLKYRPRDFSSLEGQEFIKQTLRKAVSDNKTVGAYLFCGPRGTGKTSSARIMAKAVNCKNPVDGNPCNKCEICLAVNNENLVDVIEIDAASHTGVDNIREIIEKARFQPTHATYKIYIIDEVHMLSKGAFNALLKILEEPPSYVKFILATTETHKVPETIISRCQRYDFKRGSYEELKNRLTYIAKKEKVQIDEKSLDYIIKNSSGGYRNAISLFEQLINDSEINYDKIISTLGIVEDELLSNFLDKLINEDASIVNDFDNLIADGKNIKLFFKELIFFTKDITTKKALAGENINSYLKVLSTLDETYSKTKNSLDENTTFLIGVLKIVSAYSEEATPKNKPHPTPLLKGEGIGGLDINNNNKSPSASSPLGITETGELARLSSKLEGNRGPRGAQNDEKLKTEEDISHDDISDIFGGEEEKPSPPTPLPKREGSSSSSFNKETFIEKLKSAGAKGALTMSIRGAETSFMGDTLHLEFKTAFAMKSVNTADNIALLNGALEAMGLNDVNIMFR